MRLAATANAAASYCGRSCAPSTCACRSLSIDCEAVQTLRSGTHLSERRAKLEMERPGSNWFCSDGHESATPQDLGHARLTSSSALPESLNAASTMTHYCKKRYSLTPCQAAYSVQSCSYHQVSTATTTPSTPLIMIFLEPAA